MNNNLFRKFAALSLVFVAGLTACDTETTGVQEELQLAAAIDAMSEQELDKLADADAKNDEAQEEAQFAAQDDSSQSKDGVSDEAGFGFSSSTDDGVTPALSGGPCGPYSDSCTCDESDGDKCKALAVVCRQAGWSYWQGTCSAPRPQALLDDSDLHLVFTQLEGTRFESLLDLNANQDAFISYVQALNDSDFKDMYGLIAVTVSDDKPNLIAGGY